jgi:Domain of unknown function (DUF4398)
MFTGHKLLAATLVSLLVANCASQPAPKEELSRARTLIDQAERSGAQRFAEADLNAARGKFQVAETDARDKNNDIARHRANEAAADAELAIARTASGRAQSAAAELQSSLVTLRQEAERGAPASAPIQNR